MLSVPARIAAVARALVPEVTAEVLAAVNRLLPRAMGPAAHRAAREKRAPRRSPSVLTVLGDRAARRNNQVPGPR